MDGDDEVEATNDTMGLSEVSHHRLLDPSTKMINNASFSKNFGPWTCQFGLLQS